MQAYRVLPLALLYASGGEIKGRTRFQKLAFLADQKLEDHDIDPYDFQPYKYGPFDDDLYNALEWLEAQELVEGTKRRSLGGDPRYDYRLTHRGRRSVEQNIPTARGQTLPENSEQNQKDLQMLFKIAEDVVDEFGEMPVSNLIKYVYSEYPEYAEKSVLY